MTNTADITKHTEPWRHWTIDNILSAHCLKNILSCYGELVPAAAKIPDIPLTDPKYRKSTSHDCEINITQDLGRKSIFLQKLIDHFRSTSVVPFFESLMPKKKLKGSFLRVQLIRDINGFNIDIHSDNKLKILTAQIFLTQEHNVGTQLFDMNKSIYKHIPSTYNSMFLFFPNYSNFLKTWHGFIDTKIETVRDMIMINYFSDIPDFSDGEEMWRV